MDSTVVPVLHIILGKPDFLQLATPWSELDFNDPHSVLACVIRGSAVVRPVVCLATVAHSTVAPPNILSDNGPSGPLHYESSLGNYQV